MMKPTLLLLVATGLFTNSVIVGADFEDPIRLKTQSNEPITVESPGYACPTVVDLDGDGAKDLVVGQFRDGAMKFYRNLAPADSPPSFAEGEFLKQHGSKRRVSVEGVY